jgi:uncharacterized protein with PQ loop repeat
MEKSGIVIHHYIKKKRIKYKTNNKDKLKKLIDKLIYPIAIAGPLVTIPQIIKIWIGKEASGVSVFSWSSFVILNFIWLIYGILHKDKPIIITSGLAIVIDISIALGALIYG